MTVRRGSVGMGRDVSSLCCLAMLRVAPAAIIGRYE